MAKTLEHMTVDELTERIVRLSNERERLRQEQKAVSEVRDRKLTEQYEREKLEAVGIDPKRIDAMVRVSMQTVGVEAQDG